MVRIMPRAARRKSESNIYHVILRSINKQQLFEDDEDRDKLFTVLRECKELSGFELYAYCLMSNHIHFLLKTGKEDLETVFRRIGARFVYWYNAKYGRVGHLFQDRYKSEAVEDDAYFLTVLRYIHQNPVKAGICTSPEEYRYSSYPRYFDDKLIDSAFVLSLMSREEFTAFNLAANEDRCMEISENARKRVTDEQAKRVIFAVSGCRSAAEFQRLPTARRDDAIKAMLEEGMSIRQTSRMTGISVGIVRKYSR